MTSLSDLTGARPMCKGVAMRELFEAVEMFNAGDWYESHEILETLWQAETNSERELYQGLLQIAVGLWHNRRGNRKGAMRLCSRGLERLRKFPHTCKGMILDDFISQMEQILTFLDTSHTDTKMPDELIPFIHRISDPR